MQLDLRSKIDTIAARVVRGSSVVSKPIQVPESLRFGDDFELDLRAYELREAGRPLKLERIPMDLLVLLVEHRGVLVTRGQIIKKSGERTFSSIRTPVLTRRFGRSARY